MAKLIVKIFSAVLSFAVMASAAAQPSFADCSVPKVQKSVLTDNDYRFYAGAMSDGGGYKGIYARIKLPVGLPNVSGSGESAWVSTKSDGSKEWLKTGARYYSGYRGFKLFVESYKSGKYEINESQGLSVGDESKYWIQYLDSDGKWHAYFSADGTDYGVELAGSYLASAEADGVQANAELNKENIQMGPFGFSCVMYTKEAVFNAKWVRSKKAPTVESPYAATVTADSFTVYGPVSVK